MASERGHTVERSDVTETDYSMEELIHDSQVNDAIKEEIHARALEEFEWTVSLVHQVDMDEMEYLALRCEACKEAGAPFTVSDGELFERLDKVRTRSDSDTTEY